MSLIRPFAGLRPGPSRAAEVLGPPYDVLSSDEARDRAAGRPYSFLHVSRPEIDLPPDTSPYDPRVYARARDNFKALQRDGILRQDASPCYYLYRLRMGDHTQTGLVAVASVAAYNDHRIRRHEHTRPEKEDDRTRHIEALDAQTGPVFLTYRSREDIDALVAALSRGPAEIEVRADDHVQHQLWPVCAAEPVAALSALFANAGPLYIADGHHRCAAAARVAATRAGQGSGHADWFLAVLFPHRQVQILDYNRVVADLGGLSADDFLARVAQRFEIETSSAAVRPAAAGEFGLYLPGRWQRLRIRAGEVSDDPVERLDVSVLDRCLLAPVLGIEDVRRDPRIDFVGGIRGLEELERRVDSGRAAAAFSLFPTGLDDLMAVADAGQVMPPKSTWFEPKLADGMVSYLL